MDESLRGRRPRPSDLPPFSPTPVTPERANFLPAGLADNGRWSLPADLDSPDSPDSPRAQRGRGASLSDSPGRRRWLSRHGSRRKFILEVRGCPPTPPGLACGAFVLTRARGAEALRGTGVCQDACVWSCAVPQKALFTWRLPASDGQGQSRRRHTPRDLGVPALSGPWRPFRTLKSPFERPVGFLRRTRASVASKRCC